eukprot:13863762-Heterocapsa_arctica.AAC.1
MALGQSSLSGTSTVDLGPHPQTSPEACYQALFRLFVVFNIICFLSIFDEQNFHDEGTSPLPQP